VNLHKNVSIIKLGSEKRSGSVRARALKGKLISSLSTRRFQRAFGKVAHIFLINLSAKSALEATRTHSAQNF
jgi:hypothetical protein